MTDFGGQLRLARERRGLSLRQIAASTKISVAALEALERNDTSKLPGGIFSRAFVRSYAAEVGLDPDKTVREFLERFEQQQAETETVRQPPLTDAESQFDSQQRMAGVVLRLVVVSVGLIGVILYFTLRSRPSPPAGEPVPAEAAVPSPEAAQPGAAPGTPPVLPHAASRAPSPSASEPASQSRDLTLELHPTAECWVSLTVDGTRVFSRIMQAGEREHATVRREAVVEVGNAGAFAYSINGKEGPPLGTAGQVKTLRVTPETSPR